MRIIMYTFVTIKNVVRKSGKIINTFQKCLHYCFLFFLLNNTHYVVFYKPTFVHNVLTGDDWNDGFAEGRFLLKTKSTTYFKSLSRQIPPVPNLNRHGQQSRLKWGKSSLNEPISDMTVFWPQNQFDDCLSYKVVLWKYEQFRSASPQALTGQINFVSPVC